MQLQSRQKGSPRDAARVWGLPGSGHSAYSLWCQCNARIEMRRSSPGSSPCPLLSPCGSISSTSGHMHVETASPQGLRRGLRALRRVPCRHGLTRKHHHLILAHLRISTRRHEWQPEHRHSCTFTMGRHWLATVDCAKRLLGIMMTCYQPLQHSTRAACAGNVKPGQRGIRPQQA